MQPDTSSSRSERGSSAASARRHPVKKVLGFSKDAMVPRKWAWDLLVAALLVVGSLWIWRVSRINQELGTTLRYARALAERATVLDRLVGRRVPLDFLHETIGIPDGDRDVVEVRLLWIVDLERCANCLTGGFAVWNALAEDRSVSRHLLVVGAREVPDHASRALRGTTIAAASREEIETALGPLLPDTKALVDHSGTILMSDSRAAASECGWSFEAQVGAVRGVLASGVIRSQP